MRRQRDAWSDSNGDGGKCEVSGRRKGKLGFLFRKGKEGKKEEEEEASEKNESGTFLLYTEG